MFKLIKDYIDTHMEENHSADYKAALSDINDFVYRLEFRNVCLYCGQFDVKYPHECNGFLSHNREEREWVGEDSSTN